MHALFWVNVYVRMNFKCHFNGYHKVQMFKLESVAGSVIQATGTVEFEDGLRTGVLPGGCWGP